MTDIEPEEDLPPVAHVTIVYNGPTAPHWDLRVRYGDQKMMDDFWARVNARLLLLPKHDPQFRRNKERVNRDAERERITCDWDLGEDDAETTITPVQEPVAAEAVAEAAPAEPEVEAVDSGAESEGEATPEPTTDSETVEAETAEAEVAESEDAEVEAESVEEETDAESAPAEV